MLALSPPLFSTFGWPLEDQQPFISHEQNNYIYRDSDTPESFLHLPSSSPQFDFDQSTPSATFSGDPTMVKKLTHNASERHRRKKINTLYSTLRSLLPPADQLKKLSIPATVSRVLKFIPEQQQHVERLIQKKEELLSRISKQGYQVHPEKQKNLGKIGSTLSAVSASRLGDGEVMIQIPTFKVHKNPLSEILLHLEEDGLHVINASTFESYGGRVFYNLHLQSNESQLAPSKASACNYKVHKASSMAEPRCISRHHSKLTVSIKSRSQWLPKLIQQPVFVSVADLKSTTADSNFGSQSFVFNIGDAVDHGERERERGALCIVGHRDLP